MANAPIRKYSFGAVQVAVWEQEVGKGKDTFTSKSVSVNKSYKDKDGKWKQGQSFKFSEIPLLILGLQQAMIDNYKREDIDKIDFPGEE